MGADRKVTPTESSIAPFFARHCSHFRLFSPLGGGRVGDNLHTIVFPVLLHWICLRSSEELAHLVPPLYPRHSPPIGSAIVDESATVSHYGKKRVLVTPS